MSESGDRDRRAAELKLAGATYDSIARELDYESALEASVGAQRALGIEPEESPVGALRLEKARLDALLEGLWPKAQTGDVPSVREVLRLLARREKVAGQITGGEVPVSDPVDPDAEPRGDDDVVTSLEARRAERGRATSALPPGAG